VSQRNNFQSILRASGLGSRTDLCRQPEASRSPPDLSRGVAPSTRRLVTSTLLDWISSPPLLLGCSEALLLHVLQTVVLEAERLLSNPKFYFEPHPSPLPFALAAVQLFSHRTRENWAAMADGDHADRLQLLWDDRTETRVALYLGIPSTPNTVPPVQTLDIIEHANAQVLPQFPPSLTGSRSTVSSSSSEEEHRNSDIWSQKSAPVTVATSVTGPPPNQPLSLDQYLAMGPLPAFDYELPCELCGHRFQSGEEEDWITHMLLSHFPGASPPSKTTCIFCQTKFDCVKRQLDPRENWRERMEHIRDHLRDGVAAESARPDPFVIKHMRGKGKIDPAQHNDTTDREEEPYCPGLKPRGFVPFGKVMKRERALQEAYDLGKEERLRRRENSTHKGKGKGKELQPSSRQSTARSQR
jgi:hypothetical protein